MSAHQTTWTEDRIAIVTREWTNGHSAGQIALKIGCTRNAVIGKVHRLGLCGPKLAARTTRPPKPAAPLHGAVYVLRRPKYAKAKTLTPEHLRAIAAMEPIGPAIEHANADQCRYIRDAHDTPICGRRTLAGSWCKDHARLVYQPSKAAEADALAVAA